MRNTISSIESEYRKYKKLAELAIDQLSDDEILQPPAAGTNAIVSVVWHLSGNLKSRFTDFLTEDGEKPWRHREDEFTGRHVTRDDLLARWNEAWSTLFDSLQGLADSDLSAVVHIAGKPHRVDEALLRSLAHATYHVGQIVYYAKMLHATDWKEPHAVEKK